MAHNSIFYNKRSIVRTVLYISVTESEVFEEGIMENVSHIKLGYSSFNFSIINDPMPDPVPPPSEWEI